VAVANVKHVIEIIVVRGVNVNTTRVNMVAVFTFLSTTGLVSVTLLCVSACAL